MRATFAGLLFSMVASVSTSYASDVDYTLKATDASEFTQPEIAKPFEVVIQDRVWVAKGIEEGIDNSVPIVPTWGAKSYRIRIEQSPGSHQSYFVPDHEINVQPPEWIGDVLWPRTIELLHYASVAPAKPQSPETIVFFGPPYLQHLLR